MICLHSDIFLYSKNYLLVIYIFSKISVSCVKASPGKGNMETDRRD